MTEALIFLVVILCLTFAVTVLACSVPFLFYKCFRLEAKFEAKMAEQDKSVEILDETVARLLESVGVPVEKKG